MSNLYQRLCKAVSDNDFNELKNITDYCKKTYSSNEVREFCKEITKDWNNFAHIMNSGLSSEDQKQFIVWFNQVQSLQKEKDLLDVYLTRLSNILSIYKGVKVVALEVNTLNKDFLSNSNLLFNAFTECFVLVMNCSTPYRLNFYKSLIGLATEMKIFAFDQESIANKFYVALYYFQTNGFSQNDIAEILSIHPAKHLHLIFKLYGELIGLITRKEFQDLVLRVKWQDWNVLEKSPLSINEKAILIHHLRNHKMESLVCRAYTLLYQNGEDSYEKANSAPFAIIQQYGLVDETYRDDPIHLGYGMAQNPTFLTFSKPNNNILNTSHDASPEYASGTRKNM
ncbi:MAG: hypothetical protein Q8M40_11575 [Legionella sp.]|nr:hypothetical protein [Legionella sp.]